MKVFTLPRNGQTISTEGLEEAKTLANFYSQLLAFARVDCASYCELTLSSFETSAGHLLTDAVWPGLIDGILHSLPVIFNPGLANAFHKVCIFFCFVKASIRPRLTP